MRLYIQIILLVVFVALFIGSVAVILVNNLMQSALEDEMKKRCIDITQALSETIIENVINDEVLPTREILQKIVQQSKDIEFAYVVGFDGNMFAHSFEKGFPKELANVTHEISTKDAPDLERYLTEEGFILTIGCPLINGLMAHIHIGMNENNMHNQIRKSRNRIIVITLSVLLFGILLATIVSFRITAPLKRLSDLIYAYGKGEKKEDIEFHGGGREVKELTQSFKQMIKERKQADNRIIHLNLILRSLRDINQLITKEKNRDVLLQESCRIITKDKGYSNVWLVLFDEEHKVDFAAKSMIGDDFRLLLTDLKKGKLSYCAKKAIKQPEVLLIDNPEFECSDCPLSDKYEGRGAIAVRLEHNKKVYGVLCVRIEKEYLADEEMLDLFKEITGDIAFAIYRLELEAAHTQADEEQQKLVSLIENSDDYISMATLEGKILYLNNAGQKMIGIDSLEEAKKLMIDDTTMEEDLEKVQEKILQTIMQKGHWEGEFRLRHLKTGTTIPILMNAFTIRDTEKNQPIVLATVSHNITKRKQAEEQIKKDLEEKRILLQELYHRTKNNMQTISSMLKTQSRNLENRTIEGNSGIEFLQETFREVINRIRSMSLVHQKLYQAEDLSRINLKEYIKDLINLLMISYGVQSEEISLKLELEDVLILIDSAIPLGLVLNEMISNIFKHAFPNNELNEISVRLYREENETINIHLSDNGIGIPNDIDLEKVNTMGLKTAFSLMKYQLKGEINYEIDNGLKWHFNFKDNLHKERV